MTENQVALFLFIGVPALIGVLSVVAVAVARGRTETETEEGEVPERQGGRWWRRGNATFAAYVVVASLIFIGIGTSQILRDYAEDQRLREDENQRQCLADYSVEIEDFASDLIDTIDARVGANTEVTQAERRLDDAEAARDEALDRLLVIVGNGVEGNRGRFEESLRAANRASNQLVRVRERTINVRRESDVVRQQNPYPEAPNLQCRSGG